MLDKYKRYAGLTEGQCQNKQSFFMDGFKKMYGIAMVSSVVAYTVLLIYVYPYFLIAKAFKNEEICVNCSSGYNIIMYFGVLSFAMFLILPSMLFYGYWSEKKKLFNGLSADQVLECIKLCTISEEADNYRLYVLKNRKELRLFDLNNIQQLAKESNVYFETKNSYYDDLNKHDIVFYKK